MTVAEAIAVADQLLPGVLAPDGEVDPRWQAIIEMGHFVKEEPETIWPFVLKWGSHEDKDVQAAIATCLLEDLLEHHFDLIIARVEVASKANVCFAATTKMCWKFGQAKEPARSERFDRLLTELRAPEA